MTDFKRRTLSLTTGKQIKLYGNSLAIGASLEIGEGSAPNMFAFVERPATEIPDATINPASSEGKFSKQNNANKNNASVLNPHQLTVMDLLEIADYNIRLWMDLKDNIRKYGVANPKVFNSDALR